MLAFCWWLQYHRNWGLRDHITVPVKHKQIDFASGSDFSVIKGMHRHLGVRQSRLCTSVSFCFSLVGVFLAAVWNYYIPNSPNRRLLSGNLSWFPPDSHPSLVKVFPLGGLIWPSFTGVSPDCLGSHQKANSSICCMKLFLSKVVGWVSITKFSSRLSCSNLNMVHIKSVDLQ